MSEENKSIELVDEEAEKVTGGIGGKAEQIKFLINKISSLEKLLLIEDDPEEIANIKAEIEMYKKILDELMRNQK